MTLQYGTPCSVLSREDSAATDITAVVGIDPSVTSTGWCVTELSDSTEPVEVSWWGNFHHPSLKDDPVANELRYMHLGDEVGSLLDPLVDVGRNLLVVLEDAVNVGRSAGNAIKGALAQGAIRYVLQSKGVPYVLVPPTTLKKFATGKGVATKVDMGVAAVRRANLVFSKDDECDAWWLSQFGAAHLMWDPLGLPTAQLAVARVPRDIYGAEY